MPVRRPRRWRRLRNVGAFLAFALLLPSIATVLVVSASREASAALPPINQTFYVPLPEAQVLDSFELLTGNAADPTITNVVSIIATQSNAIIEYDHWEDGFENDVSNPSQSTTEVWGDSDASNGCAGTRLTPPLASCTDADDVIAEGDVFIVENNVPAQPRVPGTGPGNLFFDGGDKISSTSFIVVSQASQPDTIGGNPGSLLGGAVQVYDLLRYGTEFVIPIGEDLTAGNFNRLGEYTTVFIMASEDNTVVDIDTDGDGTTDVSRTIDEGESIHVDQDLTTATITYPNRTDYDISAQILSGARVTSSAPVQTYVAAASRESNYQARFFELVPTAQWDSEYYATVSTRVAATNGNPDIETALMLFNPTISPINVTLEYRDGTTTVVNVPANGTQIAALPIGQTNSGVRVTSTSNFFALSLTSSTDATSTSDWGYTLLPADGLTRSLKAGWAPGSADTTSENSNPIWFTSTEDARVYIDYGGDGIGPSTAPNGAQYDLAVDLQALELYTILETDNDQTGTRIFSLDDTGLAGAWGQDGSLASPGVPGLDLGTTVFPGPSTRVTKDAALQNDVNGNGLIDVGDTLRYTVIVENDSTVVASGTNIVDEPDQNADYVLGSTTIDGSPLADDSSPATPMPLDEAGYLIGDLASGATMVFVYDVVVNPDVDPSNPTIINTATMTSSAGGGIASTLSPVKFPSLAFRKLNDDADGLVDPGQVVTFTLEATNTDAITQTDLEISDVIPPGFTYVPESTLAVGTDSNQVAHSVRDEFSTASYSNNDGDDNWDTDWNENGEGDNPTGGRIQIIGGQLVFDNLDGRTIERQVDLSAPDVTFATLSLNYDIRDINNEGLDVELWNGSSWDLIANLDDDVLAVGTVNHVLTPAQVSANTQIRFSPDDSGWSTGEIARIDNVQISWDTGSTTAVTRDNVPGGANPDLVDGDPTAGPIVVPADGFSLAQGDKLIVTYQATVDIDALGDLTNVAGAFSNESPDVISDQSTVTVVQPMTLDVEKVDTLNGTGIAGDTIDYDITITNTSNVSVTDIDVTDSLADADASMSCTPVEPFTLATGESATCTATHTVSQAEVDAGEVSNVATASGLDFNGDPVVEDSDDPDDPTDVDPDGDGIPDDPTVTPLLQQAELQVSKTDTLNGTGTAGDTIDYAIIVDNTGTVTIDGIDVSDSLLDADASLSCTPAENFTLVPGETANCTATHTVTQSEADAGQVSNTATASGTDPGGNPVSDDSDDPDDPTDVDPDVDGEPDDPTVTPLTSAPELQVFKTDTVNGSGGVGDTIDYSITLTNTGNVTIDGITVADSLADADASLVCSPVEPFTLAPGVGATCTATHTITQADLDAGQVTNTATASGTDPGSNPVTDDSDDPADLTDDDPDGDGEPDDPTVTPLTQSPALEVIRSHTLNGTGVAGDTIDFTTTVDNTGDVTISSIDVTSSLGDDDASLVCTPAEPFTLAPGASATCTSTHTVTQAEVDAGQSTSNATATGTTGGGGSVSDDSDDPNDSTDVDPDGDGEPDDPNVVPLDQTADLTVQKTDTLNGTGVAGDTIDYSITVTNAGAVTLSSVTLSDSLPDADASLDCSPTTLPTTLAPGASFSCTATHTVTQADVDAGQVTNTATATGDDPGGTPVTDDSDDPDDPTDDDPDGDGEPDDPTVTDLLQQAELQVSKTDTLNGTGTAGDTIDYTITVTNTGTVTVDGIDVSDSLADADTSLSCTPGVPFTLAAGESATCTATHTVTQAEVDAGQVSNSATASGDDPGGAPVVDDSDDPENATDIDPDGDGEPDDPTITPLSTDASLEVTKVDTLNGAGVLNDTVDYSIMVTNTGTRTISAINLTDSLPDADASLSCTPAEPFTLTPGATATCTATHTIDQSDIDGGAVVNTVSATGDDPGGTPISDASDDPDDPTDVDPDGDGEPDDPTLTPLSSTAGLDVTKTDVLNGVGAAGDTIDYTITVGNTGTSTLSNLTVTDSLADADASLDCSPTTLPATLAPGATFSCTASHTVTQAEADAGQVTNTATVSGEDPGGNPVTDDSDDPDDPTDDDPDGDGNPDDPTITPLNPPSELQLTKSDTLNGVGGVGDTIDYFITVTNTGGTTISDIDVTDSLADADASLVCSPVEPFVLAPGFAATCNATHTITQADIDSGQVVNVATASGTDPASNPVADDSDDPADLTDTDPDGDDEPDDPTITPLTQAADLRVDKTDTLNGTGIAGDTIDYNITITNAGNVTVDNIDISDSLADADASLSCTLVEPITLAPSATATCTATHTVTQAEVDAGFVSNTVTATGTDPSSNVVADDSDDPDDPTDADPDGDGEPDDPTITPLAQAPGLQVTKTDTLNGSGAAGDTIDYAIVVSNTGTVTISNLTVSDSLADADASLDCSPTVLPTTLAPGGSFSCTATHTVTQAEVDSGSVTNTATADGENPGGQSVSDDSDDPDDTTDIDPDGDGEPDDPTVTPLTAVTELQLTKTDTLNGSGVAGDTIDYTITLTNTGTSTVSNITIADSLADADASLDCSPTTLPATLAPTGSFSCTATHTITQAEIDAGQVINTAAVSGTDPGGNPTSDNSDDPDDTTDIDPDGDGEPDDPTVTPLTQSAGLSVTKVDTLNGTGVAGDTIDYAIEVTNEGTVTSTVDSVSDSLADADASLDCSPTTLPVSLAPGASFDCTATHTVTQGEVDSGSVANTATAAGTDSGGNPISDDSDDPDDPTDDDPNGDGNPDDPTVTPLTQAAGLSVTKVDTLNGAGTAGDTIDYTIVVANDGTTTATVDTVTDSLADADASLDCSPATLPAALAPTESFTCTATHTITQTEVDTGSVTNTATASGTDSGGNPISDDSDDPDDPTDDDPNGDGNPDDPTVTPLSATDELQVTKTDSLGGTGVAGDVITYSIDVANTGARTIDNIDVSDSLPGVDATLNCAPTTLPATLAPGGSFSCSATHTITQAEVDAGSVTNVATAAGTNPGGNPVTDDSDDPDDTTDDDPDGDGEPDDPTVTPLDQRPEIQVSKVDTLGGTGIAGDTITYTIVTENTGTTTVTVDSISDSLPDADASVSCAPTTLPVTLLPGESFTCTASHTVTQAEVDSGNVSNVATADGTDQDGNPISDDSDDPDDPTDDDPDGDGEPDDPTVTPLSRIAELRVNKTDSLNGTGVAGDTIDYTITTVNNGTVTIDGITVVDSLADVDASLDCSPTAIPATLAPGESFTCTGVHTITQAEVDGGSVTNTATASGTDPLGAPVDDDSDDPTDPTNDDPDGDGEPDDPTVTPLTGSNGLEVTKTDILSGTGIAGDTITYVITTTNTGSLTLSNITISDSLPDADASLDCLPTTTPATLAPGESFSCSATHTVTQADVDAGSVSNIATATGEDPGGNPVDDLSDDPDDPTNVDDNNDGEPDDPTVTPLNQIADIQVVKADSLNGSGVAGDTIDYTITVVNAGTVTASGITVSDSLADADASLSCVPAEPFTLAPGASSSCSATHTITQAEVDGGQVVNTASASGTDPGGNPIDDDSDDPDDPTDDDPDGDGEPDDPTITPLTPIANLAVTKTDVIGGPGDAGDPINYSITVTNTGTVTVSDITVSDSLADADASLSCVPAQPFTLAPGASSTCTAVHSITQAEVDAGQVVNTATADGTDPSTDPVTDDSDDPDDPTDDDPDNDGDPEDPTVTTLTQRPELQLTKIDTLNGTGIAGDTIDYSIVVTNTGNVTVSNIDVSDSLADADASLSCTPVEQFDLAPGESATCSATHTVTQAEVNNGFVDNVADASGDDPGGSPVVDDSDDPDDPTDTDPDGDGEPDDPTTTPLDQTAELSVTKTDTLNGTGVAGDTIDYVITITNTGAVTVDNITVADSLADADASLDCSPTTVPADLDPGESFSCTATHTIVQAEVDAGQVVNVATATGDDPSDNPVTDDSDDPDNPADDDPDGDGNPDDPTVTSLTPVTEIQVTKTDTLNGTGIAGDTIDYTIAVVNSGNVTVTIDSVTDPNADAGSIDCSPTTLPVTLAPSESFTCAATHTITQAEVDAGQVVNTATADGTDPGGNPVSDDSDDPDDPTNDDPDNDGEPDDPTVVPLTQSPELQVTKTDLLAGSGAVGDDINYTITVRNTGTVTITDIDVADSLGDADASLSCAPAEPFSLAPGATSTCTATHTITQADLDAGQVVNTATAAGLDHLGQPTTDDSDDPADTTDDDPDGDGEPDDPTVTPLAQNPDLNVVKTDSVNGTGSAGDTIDYTITTTNTGNVTITGVTLTDSLADADASIDCSPTTLPADLAPGEAFTCSAVHTITQAEVDAGSVTNVATASGDDPGGTPVTDDSDDPDDPTNDDPDGDGEPDDPTVTTLTPEAALSVTKVDLLAGSGVAGDTITYTITTTNTGNVTITGIDVADDLGDADASMSCTPVEAFDLAPGTSATCSATHTVTQAEVDAGLVSNVATATGTDPGGNPVTDDSDDPDDPTDDDANGDGEPDDPTETPLNQIATLEVAKADAIVGTGAAGETIDYTIVVVNTGTVTLSGVDLADSLADADASIDCSPTSLPTSLAPGESFTCSAVHTITQAEVDSGSVTNVATATGDDPGGTPVTDDSDDPDDPTNDDPDGDGEPDDPTVTVLPDDSTLEVTKAGIVSGTGVVGDTINYTIEVRNTGIVTVSDIGLADSLPGVDGTLSCGVALPATLTPNASFTCTASHTIAQADIDAGGVTNVATASGTSPAGDPVVDESDDPNDPTDVDPDNDGEPDDPTFNPLSSTSRIEVLKTASIANTATEGDLVDYTIVVINSGATTLSNVDVTDNNIDAGSLDCSPVVLTTTMNPGESFTCVATHTITVADLAAQEIVNTATATGEDPSTQPVTDDSDDPTEPANVDPDNDGNPDDPTVVTLIPPVSTGNSFRSPTPASPDNPTVIQVIIDDFDTDGVIDPTSVSIVGGTDLDGDGLNDELIVPGEGIWTVDRTTGLVTYTPEAGFTLDPTPISYTVNDDLGLTSNPSEISIDYPPVASDDSSTGNEIGSVVAITVVDNDTDGDTVVPGTIGLVGGTDTDGDGLLDTLIVNGQGIWTANPATGAITFTPDDGFTADPDPVDYTVSDDDGNFTQGTVTVGYLGQVLATVSGTIFNDLDNSGARDQGEPALQAVEVELRCDGPDGQFDTADDFVRRATTGQTYEFTDVPFGSTCRVTPDRSTLSNFTTQTSDPDGDLDGTTTIDVNGAVTGVDFGYRAAPQLSLTGRNVATSALFGLLLILLGLGFVILPGWYEEYREPEFY